MSYMAAFNISQNKTVLRQSYRMFIEKLIEAHYPRLILGLSRIPHLTTLQKFIGRINYSLLDKDNFIFHCDQRHQAKSLWLQIRLDLRLSCFTVYIGRTELKIKFAKLSIAAETYYNKSYVQMTRWAPTRHDNIDYKSIIISTKISFHRSKVQLLRGYDSEDSLFQQESTCMHSL